MSTRTLSQLLNVDDPLRHLVRFMTVGALGTLLDVGAFALLHAWLGLPALPANVASYSLGTLNNYILHRRWTYAGRPAGPRAVAAILSRQPERSCAQHGAGVGLHRRLHAPGAGRDSRPAGQAVRHRCGAGLEFWVEPFLD